MGYTQGIVLNTTVLHASQAIFLKNKLMPEKFPGTVPDRDFPQAHHMVKITDHESL